MSSKEVSEIHHKKLFIFDWDGTLMDSISQIVSSMQVAAKQFNISITDDAIRNIIGLGLPEAMQILFPEHEDKWQKIRQSYGDDYVLNSHNTELYHGITELTQQLQKNGKYLAVATGKSRKGLDRVLDESGLRPFFITSRGADETKSKPDPLMLEEILQETGIVLADAVMIGDSSYDMAMAKNLNMDSVAVTYGVHDCTTLQQHSPRKMVNTVAELTKVLLS